MMKRRAKVDYARWVFVLPALLVVGILLIYPIFSSLYYSMTTKHLIRLTYDFIGLENYKAVLADPNFFKAFLNSVLWTLGSLAGQLIIGFTGALAINRVNFGKGIYRTLMIIPWAFPSIVIALSWKWILNGVSGFIPNILVQLGICNELPQFLSDNSFVFLTLIFINIWFGAPMIMVNVLSALQTIPQDQYEAAQIDGASKVQQFWYITVPHIKVVVGLLVVLRTIWVFNNFDIIYLLTGGGPANATTTMPIYAYNMGWNTKLLGRSSAVTMLCEVGYMHMNDSDFQTLGAASILTKKVSEWKGETEKKWDGYHIFEEAKKGDKLCLLAIDEMVDILGEGIANICYVINPEVVVLGGGIMAQEQFLKERVECAVKRYLVSSIEEHTKIVFAKHQNDAGMLGAFYHFCSLH